MSFGRGGGHNSGACALGRVVEGHVLSSLRDLCKGKSYRLIRGEFLQPFRRQNLQYSST